MAQARACRMCLHHIPHHTYKRLLYYYKRMLVGIRCYLGTYSSVYTCWSTFYTCWHTLCQTSLLNICKIGDAELLLQNAILASQVHHVMPCIANLRAVVQTLYLPFCSVSQKVQCSRSKSAERCTKSYLAACSMLSMDAAWLCWISTT